MNPAYPEDERLAQQPIPHAIRLRAAKVAHGDIDSAYTFEGVSFFTDLQNPEFQRLLTAHANPPKKHTKQKNRPRQKGTQCNQRAA